MSRSLVNAPIEDEEISEREARVASCSHEWFKGSQGTSFGDVLAAFGFSMDQIRNGGNRPEAGFQAGFLCQATPAYFKEAWRRLAE